MLTVSVTDNAADTRYVSSVSFGALKAGSMPATRLLTISNSSDTAVTVTLSVTPQAPAKLVPVVSPAPIVVPAGRSASVSMLLSGAVPEPGAYSGVINIQGGNVPLRVPYLYFVSDGKPANWLQSSVEASLAGAPVTLWVKLMDRYGVPVPNTAIHWITDSAKSSLPTDYSNTNRHGIATISGTLGTQSSDHPFWAQSGDVSAYWNFTTQPKPALLPANALLNAASFDPSQTVGAGSYASVFGADMSTATGKATTARLPVALEGVSVGFEVATAGLRVPGHVSYVSPGQINIQVPWELAPYTSARMWVRSGTIVSDPVNVRLAGSSPAFFEIGDSVPAALDLSYQLITASHPAERGKTVMLFANGLGLVTNTPPSGEPAGAAPLSAVPASAALTVTIGGRPAQVQFAGLAPGFPALYQLNVVVPPGTEAGKQPIAVTAGGRTSKACLLPVL
jgi:minor extracellular serine protease Vpr